jgi:adenylosuccinate synthase
LLRDRLAPYVADTTTLLLDAVEAGRTILLEGQLGTLRDPDHGIYPYPTSSSPLAGFGSVGAGVPPWAITRVVAVTKAYSSCVGAGPFVTELHGDEGETLRKLGGSAGEYGATTGRPRRVGWFDCVATLYGCRVQGATEAAITNLDVLSYRDSIPVCTAYSIGGKATTSFPVSRMLDKAQPIYEKLPGWKTNLTGVRKFEDLPEKAREYVLFVEKRIRTRIKWISVGPHRDQIIKR